VEADKVIIIEDCDSQPILSATTILSAATILSATAILSAPTTTTILTKE